MSGPAGIVVPNDYADERLVRECIEGSEEAWSALIDKYRRLIFSIPFRYGLSREDASEVFQEVCLTLLAELPRVRDPRTLAAWIIRVTASRAFRWRKAQSRFETPLDRGVEPSDARCEPQAEVMLELLREQALREAIAEMPRRCAALVEMLFFADPPLPYQEVAEKLAIAKGSVGFIRMRCLKRLRRKLEEKGFR
jgi:RNA polymerase sigma factor (sigma-70 family)